MSGVKGRSGGKRIGSGRKAFMPTVAQREQVAYLAQLGLSGEDILLLMKDQHGQPIHLNTFIRLFQEELQKGQAESLTGKLQYTVINDVYQLNDGTIQQSVNLETVHYRMMYRP